MLSILANTTYRRLLFAQILALVGTGLASVALGLLAFDMDPNRASLVIGTILTIKMVAYVGLSPFAAALAERVPRRQLLISLDLLRALCACALPFATELWQVYLIIFLLQAASACFTPVFQAVIPDVLPDEETYTRALSLSRLAYDIESLFSPALAGLLLLVLPAGALFGGTVAGFLASALLVTSIVLPVSAASKAKPFWGRVTHGFRIYLATPRLRGLLGLNLAIAAGGSMVLVNTVTLVRTDLGLGEGSVALVLGYFGGGSMLAALALPRVLRRFSDRQVTSSGAIVMITALLGLTLASAKLSLVTLCALWLIMGLGYATCVTPGGRLIRKSASSEDRPALFAAQFALSHLCWLILYPLSGWLMTQFNAPATALILATIVLSATGIARLLWSGPDSEVLAHDHPELAPNHPHLQHHTPHAHAYHIDALHPHWPKAPKRPDEGE